MKYFVEANKNGEMFTLEIEATNENTLRRMLQKEKINIEKYVEAKGHHICKYCNGIAIGVTKDILCEDCRRLFGHKFYSEL